RPRVEYVMAAAKLFVVRSNGMMNAALVLIRRMALLRLLPANFPVGIRRRNSAVFATWPYKQTQLKMRCVRCDTVRRSACGGSYIRLGRLLPTSDRRSHKPASFTFAGNFDPQSLRTFPPALLACLRESRPIVLPIARDAREERCVHRHSFVSAQHDA